MTLPPFVLGHNALIGVNHVDRASGGVKLGLTDADRALLSRAAEIGVRAILLDSHPVAAAASRYLTEEHPEVAIVPMVPYAQGVVDSASRGGLVGVAREMAATSLAMGAGPALRTAANVVVGKLPAAGAHVAMGHYLKDFPRAKPPVIFLHNAVTDLLLGWGAMDALAGFAAAARARGAAPGFVTLNPGSIPRIAETVGTDAWFMGAVNSRGIQMSPSRAVVEETLMNPRYNVIAMSVLGGGVLSPEKEIPRALAFPAVKSVVVGTRRPDHLQQCLALTRVREA